MKTVKMITDYDYKPTRAITIGFQAGHVYRRVTEAAVRAIIAANAGEIVTDDKPIT